MTRSLWDPNLAQEVIGSLEGGLRWMRPPRHFETSSTGIAVTLGALTVVANRCKQNPRHRGGIGAAEERIRRVLWSSMSRCESLLVLTPRSLAPAALLVFLHLPLPLRGDGTALPAVGSCLLEATAEEGGRFNDHVHTESHTSCCEQTRSETERHVMHGKRKKQPTIGLSSERDARLF